MGERKYTGDDTGLDLSWQNYLKDTWGRKDIDPPAPDRSGETVSGTTADDFHDSRTALLPERLQQESLTALQLDILRTAVIQSDATAMKIAMTVEASRPWVMTTIGEYLPEHPAAQQPSTSPHPNQTEIDDFP